MKQFYGYLRKTGQTLRETHPVIQFSAFLVFVIVIAVIFFTLVFSAPKKRHVFIFADAKQGVLRTESRYLAKTNDENRRLEQFVDELILGPVTPGYVPLFVSPVRNLGSFIRGRDAYINLAAEDTAFLGEKPPVDRAFEIFKKNVFTNFRNLAKIYLYIDGIEVYAENPYEGAGQP